MRSELTDLVVVFGAALGVAWLMRFLKAPAIIGFLCAGILIGPTGLNLVHRHKIEFFAELGLLLLLFTVGLELSPEPLLRMGKRLLAATGLQLGATTLAVAAALHGLLGLAWPAALVVGVAIALSSTAIVLKQLSDRGETDSAAGALVTGILLLQDIAVILLLIILPLFGRAGAAPLAIAWKAGLALAALVGVTLLARRLVTPLVNLVFRHGGQEFMTLFAVVMACTGAWLADLANWSWALGSCIAGLLLAQTDLRHQLRAEATPFRDVFNALFFISIGLLVDLPLLARHALPIGLAVAAILAVKIVLTAGAALAAGWPLRLALICGFSLCTVSEFGFVLAREATQLGWLTSDFLAHLVACTVGTMLLGAACVPLAEPLAAFLTRRLRPEPAPPAPTQAAPALSGHVLIVGQGTNGRNLAHVLRAVGISHLAIEMNRTIAARARHEGTPIIVGDATRRLILEKAGLQTARALVVVVAERHATRRIIAQARHARPDLYILVRTRYIWELDALYRLGARQVVAEEFETSIEIFAHVLKEFAVPDNVIDRQIAHIRAERYRMLRGRVADDRALQGEWLRLLEFTQTETFLVPRGGPACGRTIRELALRSRTGTTIVAVTRAGRAVPSPSPDFRLEADDLLVLIGSPPELSAARRYLESAPVEPAKPL